jgi:hypothetical protein
MKDEGVLTMVVTAGLFIVGRLVGGNKLTKPRVFSVVENGQRIQMAPLPGTPAFMRIGMDCNYPVPKTDLNKSMFDLYERVTNPSVDPGV